MALSHDILIGGVTTNISDGTLCWVEGYSGIGMAPSHDIEESGPEQDGVTALDNQLDARSLQLVLGTKGATMAALENNRDTLLALFEPGVAGSYRKTRANGQIRQIDFRVSGGQPDMPRQDRQGFYQKVGVTLRCADPVWYDPASVTVTWRIVPADHMAIPTAVPTEIGAEGVSESKTIAYAGRVKSFPVIRIIGPMTDCVITNVTTGKLLDLTGVVIPYGTVYTIDLSWGAKTIKDHNGDEVVPLPLTDASNLCTFCLQRGNNVVSVSGTDTSTLTRVELTYYNRYFGI